MRSLRLDAVLVQAVIAGALSFAHLHDIAEAAGQDGWKGWAYPISVDLLLVAAWRRLRTLRAAGQPATAAWTWFLIALAASLGANIATAGLLNLDDVPNWLRILVAGWPALAFLGGTLLVHNPDGETSEQTDEHPEQAPALAPPTPPDAPVTAPANVAALPTADTSDPEPAPALTEEPTPVPTPEPSQGPAPMPGPAVPPALVDHARKVADAHHAQTGKAIDAATLRARLGVPDHLADAIAAQLA